MMVTIISCDSNDNNDYDNDNDRFNNNDVTTNHNDNNKTSKTITTGKTDNARCDDEYNVYYPWAQQY